MEIIELKDVCFSYKNSTKDYILQNINLSFSENNFVTILGSNGSGKSTIIKLSAGLLKATKGKVLLQSKEIEKFSKQEISKLIAYVPQLFYPTYSFTVFEIVMMGRNPHLNLFGVEKKDDIDLVNEMLNKVGLYSYRNRHINEISSGEAQRAFIARALVQKAKIILLDEPNSHLDIKNEFALFRLLNNLREKEKIGVVLVTHHLNLANYYSDKIILLKEGEILANGAPYDIITKNNISSCFSLNENEVNIILNSEYNTINLVPVFNEKVS